MFGASLEYQEYGYRVIFQCFARSWECYGFSLWFSFPTWKAEIAVVFSAFVTLWTTWTFLGNSKIWSLFMGQMGRNVNVHICSLKYLFDKFVKVSRSGQCLYLHLNKLSSLYTFMTEKKKCLALCQNSTHKYKLSIYRHFEHHYPMPPNPHGYTQSSLISILSKKKNAKN